MTDEYITDGSMAGRNEPKFTQKNLPIATLSTTNPRKLSELRHGHGNGLSAIYVIISHHILFFFL
jgi:hypothetical protein